MSKRKLINRINKFVEDSGETFVTMAQLEGSIDINSYKTNSGFVVELIDRLFKGEAEAVIYVRDREKSSSLISYADLSEDTLLDIVNIIEAYENRELPELELNN